jgi:hypothetical protein
LPKELPEELPEELLEDPPEEEDALGLAELAPPELLAGAEPEELPALPGAALEDLLPELSEDEPDWPADESFEPALLSAPEPPAAASAPATGTAASLVLAPPLPLLRKSVTYHPEPFN